MPVHAGSNSRHGHDVIKKVLCSWSYKVAAVGKRGNCIMRSKDGKKISSLTFTCLG